MRRRPHRAAPPVGAVTDLATGGPQWWVGDQYDLPDGKIATRLVYPDGYRATVVTLTVPDADRLALLAGFVRHPPPAPKQAHPGG